jgi:hypothetical protein
VFGLALLGCARSLLRPSSSSAAELYLATLFAVPLAGFAALSLSGKQIGAHWPTPAALGALVLIPVLIERARRPGAPGRARGLLLATLGLGALMTLVAHAAVHLPPAWMAALPLAHPTRPDQFRGARLGELYGWRELGQRVARERQEMLAAQSPARGVFVLAAQYGVAAQTAFYTPGQPRVLLWERPRRHGQNYRYWDRFEELRGQDALFVTKKAERLAPAVAELREHFARVLESQRLPVLRGGREVRAFHLVRCEGFDGVPPSFP